MANGKQFPNKIIAKAKTEYYLNEETADVHFIFEVDGAEQRVGAHKILLASGSPVFHAMFYGTLKEKGDVKISDSSAKGFMDFLSLFYLDEVNITKANVFEIMDLANKYDISEGMDMCEQYLLENTIVSELCGHFGLALKYNLDKLREYCESEIRVNAVEVFKSNGFIGSSKDILKLLLELDDHNCSEVDIFDGCMAWAENACKNNGTDATQQQNLRRELGDCFYLIPFSTMKMESFSNIASANRTLFILDEVIDIVVMITSNGQTDLSKKFKRNRSCVSNNFHWNESHLIKCIREVAKRSDYVIFRNEYTVFTASSKILLGGFRFFDFLNDSKSDNKLSAVVYITKENDTYTESQDNVEFALDAKPSKSVPHEIRLKKPIVITPNTKYTIHVDFLANKKKHNNEVEGWKYLGGELTFNSHIIGENISIEFHQHVDYDDPEFSIISGFYFNKL